MEQYAQTSKDGTPNMRPMYYDFYNESIKCAKCTAGATISSFSDQQMFGPDYLVAPVREKGQQSRWVYLPQLPKGQVRLRLYRL